MERKIYFKSEFLLKPRASKTEHERPQVLGNAPAVSSSRVAYNTTHKTLLPSRIESTKIGGVNDVQIKASARGILLLEVGGYKSDTVIKIIITGNETWVHYYNHQNKGIRGSAETGSGRAHSPCERADASYILGIQDTGYPILYPYKARCPKVRPAQPPVFPLALSWVFDHVFPIQFESESLLSVVGRQP
ncbi:hypothetical protein EVAR_7607_1 [Eumeta japonica]|uniref:Uncharacterized protein n=1 Tax=Eumeta variegata TaxID=151549 RepID=A0A4C1TLH5_EUMVA|nr:hypothetical protein EVAR_7607_1 [Eumeta japonica]